MNAYDVVAIGELLIDFTMERVQEDGYPVMAAHPGGAVANFLAPLAKFGKRTALLSKVGKDAFGRRLIATAAALGIETSGITVTDQAFTTMAFVSRDASGEREFSFARKPGADLLLSEMDIDYEILDHASVIHFGTVCMTAEPARSVHQKVIRYAKEHGKLISFDPNLREPLWENLDEAREQILWGLQHADVVKISDSEVQFLLGVTPEQGAQHIMEKFNPKVVFVTLGKDGCYFQNKTAAGRVPGLQGLNVIDTAGAGDIFGGSAMWGLLNADSPLDELDYEQLRTITQFACVAASLSTTHLGGIYSVPEMEAIQAHLHNIRSF